MIGFAENGSHDGQFHFLYLNMKAFPTILAPGQFSHIRQIQQIGTIAKWFQRARIDHFTVVFLESWPFSRSEAEVDLVMM